MTSFFVIQRFLPQKIVRTRTCFAADPRPTSTSTSTQQPSETGRVPKTNDNEHVNCVTDEKTKPQQPMQCFFCAPGNGSSETSCTDVRQVMDTHKAQTNQWERMSPLSSVLGTWSCLSCTSLTWSTRSLNPVSPSAVFAGSGSESSGLGHKKRPVAGSKYLGRTLPQRTSAQFPRTPRLKGTASIMIDPLDLLVRGLVDAHQVTVVHTQTNREPRVWNTVTCDQNTCDGTQWVTMNTRVARLAPWWRGGWGWVVVRGDRQVMVRCECVKHTSAHAQRDTH